MDQIKQIWALVESPAREKPAIKQREKEIKIKIKENTNRMAELESQFAQTANKGADLEVQRDECEKHLKEVEDEITVYWRSIIDVYVITYSG